MSHIRAWLGETELTHQETDLDQCPQVRVLDDGTLEVFELDVDTGMLEGLWPAVRIPRVLTVHIPAELLPIPPLVQADGCAAITNAAELEAQPVGTLIRDSDSGEYWLRRDDRQLWHAAATWASPRRTNAFVLYQFPCQIVVLGNGVPCVE